MNDLTIGVVAAGEVAGGAGRGHQLVGKLRVYPPVRDEDDESLAPDGIHSMPMEAIAETIAQNIQDLCSEHGATTSGVGIGFPGSIRAGIIEDSPNLKQAKGAKLGEMLTSALAGRGMNLPVSIFNDAD